MNGPARDTVAATARAAAWWRDERRPAPWTSRQLAAAATAQAMGAVLIVAAWAGSARTARLEDQVGWLTLAIGGAMVAAAAVTGVLLLGRQAVGRRRRRLLADPAAPAARLRPPEAASSSWLWVPGTRRAHREGCELVTGKEAVAVDGEAVRSQRLQRCEVCSP